MITEFVLRKIHDRSNPQVIPQVIFTNLFYSKCAADRDALNFDEIGRCSQLVEICTPPKIKCIYYELYSEIFITLTNFLAMHHYYDVFILHLVLIMSVMSTPPCLLN